jgi:hypothetical protein
MANSPYKDSKTICLRLSPAIGLLRGIPAIHLGTAQSPEEFGLKALAQGSRLDEQALQYNDHQDDEENGDCPLSELP